MGSFPIDGLLVELCARLHSSGTLILQAPPGAGKTTRVPLALIGELVQAPRAEGRILLIEPRRLAAKAAATRLAESIGEPVGERVGYSVRNEHKRSNATTIEAITDGLFLRRLQAQPDLPGVGIVIFDEFHERRRDSDVALALLREARRVLRPDLKLLLMSATLQLEALSAQFDAADTLTSQGQAFPVETRHCPPRNKEHLETHVLRVLEEELIELEAGRHKGEIPPGVLVFLPGLREIDRCRQKLMGVQRLQNWQVLTLHGQLSLKLQTETLKSCNQRWNGRIVLSTSIAESSLTLDGIRLVVDAGLNRHTRFDPGTGMEGLVTMPASIASADQRRGRAGRQGPGRCIRLWSAADEQRRPAQDPPELQRADPQPTVLDLAQWGAGLGENLDWLEPPPKPLLQEGQQQLKQLKLLTDQGQITAIGQQVAAFGMHPRLGLMLIEARRWGLEALACDLAALLSERDIPGSRDFGCDIGHRLQLLRDTTRSDRHDGLGSMRQQSRQWQKQLRSLKPPAAQLPMNDPEDLAIARLIATAFPEWIALARPGRAGAFLLRQGRGAVLATSDPLSNAEALAIARLDLKERDARIRLAVPISRNFLNNIASEQGEWREDVTWNEKQQGIRAERVLRLGAIELQRQQLPRPSADLVSQALLQRLRDHGLELLPWNERCEQLRRRLQIAHSHLGAPWPNRTLQELQKTPELWIGEASLNFSSWQDLDSSGLIEALWSDLNWAQRRELDTLLPERLRIPSGREARVTYGDDDAVLSVKLQEMFGCSQGPILLNGALPVTLELLSPAGRSLQRTKDLEGFWAGSYNDVRREMRGRYPKHPWPESPMTAAPTSKLKKWS